MEDPESGLPVRKSVYGKNEQEARAKLIKALAARQDGILLVGRGRELTVRQFAERWLAGLRKRPTTEAVEGGCDERRWLQLASIREGDNPGDAGPIYQRRVERLAAAKSNQAYAEAVDVMKTIGKLTATMEPPGDFRTYVAEVRSRHRPKRNLMALLDSAGW